MSETDDGQPQYERVVKFFKVRKCCRYSQLSLGEQVCGRSCGRLKALFSNLDNAIRRILPAYYSSPLWVRSMIE
jgi:hypothetical protein